MQTQFESTPLGRLVISLFVTGTVAALVVWNMPSSKLRREAMRLAEPYVTAVGLDQNWSVFAPDPFRSSFVVSARIAYADGTKATWSIPDGGDALGAYWDFRWGKWAEWTITGQPGLCSGTALYAANHVSDGKDRGPAQVEIVVHRRPIALPGTEPPHGEWAESLVCRVDVR